MSLVTGLFFLVFLLSQRWAPPLRLQASHCSTFRIMCDVPSIAVFRSESIERFPGTASKFSLKLLGTIPVAPIVTGAIFHFRFHIHCISIHKLLYFNFFSASFCTTFLSADIATPVSLHVFSFLFLIIISSLLAVTSQSVYTAWFHLWHLPLHTLAWACVCVCIICLWFQYLRLCILSNANVYKLYHISLNIRSSPKWGIPRLSGIIIIIIIIITCLWRNRKWLKLPPYNISYSTFVVSL